MLDNDDLSALKSAIENVLPLKLMRFHMAQRFQLVTCFYPSSRTLTSPKTYLDLRIEAKTPEEITGTARSLGPMNCLLISTTSPPVSKAEACDDTA